MSLSIMDFLPWKSKKKPTDSASDAETPLYLRDDLIKERIINADFEALVCLPQHVDSKEWIATHTVGFVEHINLLCGIIHEFCTPVSCPVLTLATGPIQWADDKGKKSKCTAFEYIDYAMMFCQRCILDETHFPTKYGNTFPSTFDATLCKIHRLLSHVLSHLYISHYHHIVAMSLHGCLNTLTFHFTMLVRVYRLVDDKELAFLTKLADRLHRTLSSSDSTSSAVIASGVITTDNYQERGIDVVTESVRIVSVDGERKADGDGSPKTTVAFSAGRTDMIRNKIRVMVAREGRKKENGSG